MRGRRGVRSETSGLASMAIVSSPAAVLARRRRNPSSIEVTAVLNVRSADRAGVLASRSAGIMIGDLRRAAENEHRRPVNASGRMDAMFGMPA
jgi:hypothetical protein